MFSRFQRPTFGGIKRGAGLRLVERVERNRRGILNAIQVGLLRNCSVLRLESGDARRFARSPGVLFCEAESELTARKSRA